MRENNLTKPASGGRNRILSFRRGVLKFARQHSREFPWRSASDPYVVLIGSLLLQRTTSTHVRQVFDEFVRRWPTPGDLARAEPTDVEFVLKPLGLSRRARQIALLGQELERLGAVPLSPIVLMALPGVGPYTAHAVPIFAAHRNLPLVDWVIARVLRRYFGLKSTRRPNADKELWSLAREIARVGRARTFGSGHSTWRMPIVSLTLNVTCAH